MYGQISCHKLTRPEFKPSEMYSVYHFVFCISLPITLHINECTHTKLSLGMLINHFYLDFSPPIFISQYQRIHEDAIQVQFYHNLQQPKARDREADK